MPAAVDQSQGFVDFTQDNAILTITISMININACRIRFWIHPLILIQANWKPLKSIQSAATVLSRFHLLTELLGLSCNFSHLVCGMIQGSSTFGIDTQQVSLGWVVFSHPQRPCLFHNTISSVNLFCKTILGVPCNCASIALTNILVQFDKDSTCPVKFCLYSWF